MSRKNLLVVLVFFLLLAGCGESQEQKNLRLAKEWEAWKTQQPQPSLELSCPTEATGPFEVSVQSDSTSLVRVWSRNQDFTGQGSLQIRLALPDGNWDVWVTATKEYQVPSHLAEVAETKTISTSNQKMVKVTVDSKAPYVAEMWVDPMGEFLRIRGRAFDAVSGISSIIVGDKVAELDKLFGYFSATIPFSEITNEQIDILLVDGLGNTGFAQVQVKVPATCWVRKGPTGELLAVVTDLSFYPDGGFLGWGSDEWQQYVNGAVVKVLFTPQEWYLALVGIAISPFLVFLVVLATPSVLLALGLRKFTKAIGKVTERIQALPVPVPSEATPQIPAAVVANLMARLAGYLGHPPEEAEKFLLLQQGEQKEET